LPDSKSAAGSDEFASTVANAHTTAILNRHFEAASATAAGTDGPSMQFLGRRTVGQ
jgi:hypothetical protein